MVLTDIFHYHREKYKMELYETNKYDKIMFKMY